MDLGLQGQTAVIAGGAKGIGQAIAQAFALEGSNVVLLDLDPSVAETARALTEQHGVRAPAFIADVTDLTAMQRSAEEIARELGRIDHLIYAAAVGSGKYGFPFWNLEPSDWGRVLEVNVVGAVNFTHALVPALVRARAGTVLFLASVAGQIGSQTDPPYSASKAALLNFMQCAARDLAPYCVRVNALCPGMVATALNRSIWEAWRRRQPPERQQAFEEWAEEKVRRLIPLGREQEPQDLAAMAVFLASEQARNVTGQTLNVDGGFVMH